MPSFLLKTAPDEDRYVAWSTIVDNGWPIGDRKAAEAEYAPDRIARADTQGTSAALPGWNGPQPYGWDEREDFIVYNDDVVQRAATLRRADLWEYVNLDRHDPRRAELLTPIPCDEDCDCDECESEERT